LAKKLQTLGISLHGSDVDRCRLSDRRKQIGIIGNKYSIAGRHCFCSLTLWRWALKVINWPIQLAVLLLTIIMLHVVSMCALCGIGSMTKRN